jgi:hypothetical protein
LNGREKQCLMWEGSNQVQITNGKNTGMIKKDIQWCKCEEGVEGCVYRCKKKKRKRRKCRKLFDGISRSGEVSRIEGESETYEEYMARNDKYHTYLEEEHPRC